MDKEMWGPDDFGDFLNVSPGQFRRLLHQGKLPPAIKVARRLYWKREDVLKWAEDNNPGGNEDEPDQ